MLIRITLPYACGGVWLDNNLEVYEAPSIFRWMLGKDFWAVCAPWVRRKGGTTEVVRGSRQGILALEV